MYSAPAIIPLWAMVSGGKPSASNLSEDAVKSVKMSLREMEPLMATTMLEVLWSTITQNGNYKFKIRFFF